MELSEILDDQLVINWFRTGSSVICDPPVLNTDIDFMILTYDKRNLTHLLKISGFFQDGRGVYDQGLFYSYRKGNINLIITTDKSHFFRFLGATLVSKTLNLRDKDKRIDMFNCLTDFRRLKLI